MQISIRETKFGIFGGILYRVDPKKEIDNSKNWGICKKYHKIC